MTLKSSPGATSRLGEFQRADGTIFASIHPGWDVDHNGRFELRNVGTGHGAHAWTHMLATFNGTQNPAMYIGYNVAGGGTPIVYGEPYVCLAIEGDYNNGTQRDLEIYFEAQNAAGTIQARPVAAILKRDATTKETFAYWTSIMGKDIAFLHPKAGGDVESLRIAESYFQVQPIAGNHTIFRIRAPASRTSQLFLGYGGTDDVFAISPEATTQTAITVGNPAVTAMTIFKAGAGSAMCLGGSDNNSALTVINNAFGGGGNILTLQDASAVTKWFVDTNGNENHAEGTNIVVGTTIGTKIGTAVTQKLGFFGVVPVAQRPSHGPLTAASGFGSRERNMLNDVYSGLRALGLLA